MGRAKSILEKEMRFRESELSRAATDYGNHVLDLIEKSLPYNHYTYQLVANSLQSRALEYAKIMREIAKRSLNPNAQIRKSDPRTRPAKRR